MVHYLKIDPKYLRRIIDGQKSFEVRLNDRNYQVGDYVAFTFTEDKLGNMAGYSQNCDTWKIEYIHSGIGMTDGYVVLEIRKTQLMPKN